MITLYHAQEEYHDNESHHDIKNDSILIAVQISTAMMALAALGMLN